MLIKIQILQRHQAWRALAEFYLLPLAEDVKFCVLPNHLVQELSLISVYSPARGSLSFRDTKSYELMNSGRELAQVSKFCLCCKNFFHGGSNVKRLPLPFHTWWYLWTTLYIHNWTKVFLLALSLLLVITEHTVSWEASTSYLAEPNRKLHLVLEKPPCRLS